jgi:hypothetical protein
VIDYDFEERLVDRIALKEAIAARLTPRERRVLSRYTRYGETYREIGKHEGRSVERIRQIHQHSIRKLIYPLRIEGRTERKPQPQQTTRNTPPPGFDKAAFLRHMRWLIAKREEHARYQCARDEEEARNWRKRERDALDRIMRNEEKQGLFDPPPPPEPKPPPWTIKQALEYVNGPYHTVHNSPSYAPPPLPTQAALRDMAELALEYLLQSHSSYFAGLPQLGKWCTSVVFTRDGGQVSEAVNSIVRALPAHARLSSYPVPIEDGTLGAHATTPYASLRVTVTPDGLKLRFDVTWD